MEEGLPVAIQKAGPKHVITDCQSAPLECHRRTHPIVAAHIIA